MRHLFAALVVVVFASACVTLATPVSWTPHPERITDARADVEAIVAQVPMTVSEPFQPTTTWTAAATWHERDLVVRWSSDARVIDGGVAHLDRVARVEVLQSSPKVFVVRVTHTDGSAPCECLAPTHAEAQRLADALTVLSTTG